MGVWRRIRGALGIGTIWAVPAAVVGAIGGAISALLGGPSLLGGIVAGSLTMGSLFFALGSGFSVVLALAERNRTVDQLSPLRAGLSGAIGGGGVMGAYVLWVLTTIPAVPDPNFTSALTAAIAIYAGLGGALGVATIGIAKRAPDALPSGDRADTLPGAGSDPLLESGST